MKRFYIKTPVERVNGYQMWRVDSDGEEEALAKFNKDGGDFVDEEIEVTSTGEPEITGSEDLC